jgi:nucleoside-triphosphatase
MIRPRARRRLMGLLALACIAVQFPGSLPLSALALGVWLGALALVDRISLARLWMPRFWLITVLFALGSGLLLGTRDVRVLGLALSRVGLEAGALMVVRGAFIFGLAAWASRALGQGDIQRLARRIGLPSLGAAIPTALGLLPELRARYQLAAAQARSRPGRRGRSLHETAVQLFCQTARLAEQMAGGAGNRALAVVTGGRGAGKTTTLARLAALLAARGLRIGGVVQPVEEQQGERVGYLLRDLATGQERPFARRREEGARGFDFDEKSWAWARQRIVEARRAADVVVVDELGLLEAQGEGHLPALAEPVEPERARLWLLGVRADRAAEIEARLGPPRVELEAPATEAAVEGFTKIVVAFLEDTAETPDATTRSERHAR